MNHDSCVAQNSNLLFPRRITEAMEQILDYPLTIVETPMGYGKTIAVREHVVLMSAGLLWQNIYDDFHLVDTQQTIDFITFLAVKRITNLHIILISRFIEFFNTEELSLKGYLHHIKKETFEFSQKEIIDYYQCRGIS